MAGYCRFGGKSARPFGELAALAPVCAARMEQCAVLLDWMRIYICMLALTNLFAGLTIKHWAGDC